VPLPLETVKNGGAGTRVLRAPAGHSFSACTACFSFGFGIFTSCKNDDTHQTARRTFSTPGNLAARPMDFELLEFGFVYFTPKRKFFQDFLSHRIFRRMHRVLNINENKN